MRTLISVVLFAAMVAVAGGQSKEAKPSDANRAKLPADIDPVTLSRFPPVQREDMKESVKKYFDEQSAPSPDGTPFLQRGPQHMMLYTPAGANTMGRVMSSLREQGILNNRLTEITILVTAREISHQYIWSAHEPAARGSGVEEVVIDAIKYDKDVSGLGEKESLIIRYGRQLNREKRVSPDLFAQAVALFGRQGVVELTMIMGQYVATGMMLDAADQQQPPTRPALLPLRK
jgi:4-carboxymuconolactone decarboxylase